MKVRVIELVGSDYADGYDDYRTIYSLDEITSWEDVNQDELEALYLWASEHNNQSYAKKVVVVSEKQLDYKKTIAQYLEKAQKIKEEVREREEKKREAEEKKKKRLLESQAMKAERDKKKKLKQLARLKEELGM